MSTKEREEAMNEYGFNTGLLHGTNEKYPQGATQVPIYQSSAFRHDSAEDLEKIFDNKKMGFSYTRINNPTVESFEKRVTMLEDGIGSVACASGMAALTNAFLNILQAGDEIVKMNHFSVHFCREITAYATFHAGEDVKVTYIRDGKKQTATLTPKYDKKEGRYLYGFSYTGQERVKGNVLTNIKNSFYELL